MAADPGSHEPPHAPQTWHYGLVARWWAEFNVAADAEVAFYRDLIAANGGTALDLACGSGRLLLPLVRAGLTVEGCDISQDMIAQCARRAAQDNLTVALHCQPMHALALPGRYRTIYICDSFGIGGQPAQDRAALARIRAHLEPGGLFVLTHTLPYANPQGWGLWFAGRRGRLPQLWPEWGERRPTEDGDELALISRVEAFDPLSQLLTLEIRVGLWRDGKLLQMDEYQLQETLYFHNELVVLLHDAGFSSIDVCGGDTVTPATASDTRLTFLARVPG